MRLVDAKKDTPKSSGRVVQGAIPETTALLNLRWDHILYTGRRKRRCRKAWVLLLAVTRLLVGLGNVSHVRMRLTGVISL